MTTAGGKDNRTITQVLFSRKREVDAWPSLRGGQAISYPARRNPNPVGTLSAMLCKACLVALRGDILEVHGLDPSGDVYVKSRSQSGRHNYQGYLLGNEAYLFIGKVTYLLGLLFLAEAMTCPSQAGDLLDALEEILEYKTGMVTPDGRYDELLAHLSDELYYWARYRDGTPNKSADRLETLGIREAGSSKAGPLAREIDTQVFIDLERLSKLRRESDREEKAPESTRAFLGARFRGPELGELVESLELGMNCLLVGPTATGKSLCALEAFDYTTQGKPVFIIEGHESLQEFDLLGGFTPDGHGGFAWGDGVLTRAMRAGGFLFIDEANRMPTRTLNILLGVLSRGAVVLTERGSEEVSADPKFQVVLAMNLGQGYAVNVLDRALLDRFPCVLEFHYLPPGEEIELLKEETGIEPNVADIMVKVANETRKLRRNRELSSELTPRGLFSWARKFHARKGRLLDRLHDSASTTWLYQVAGFDSDGYLREDTSGALLSLIEAHTPK